MLALKNNYEECLKESEICAYDIGLIKKDIIKNNKELSRQIGKIENMSINTTLNYSNNNIQQTNNND